MCIRDSDDCIVAGVLVGHEAGAFGVDIIAVAGGSGQAGAFGGMVGVGLAVGDEEVGAIWQACVSSVGPLTLEGKKAID